MVSEYRIGWVVELKKQHPCGSFEWKVIRIGADIGLRCLICQRKVIMPRSTLDKRLKSVVIFDA